MDSYRKPFAYEFRISASEPLPIFADSVARSMPAHSLSGSHCLEKDWWSPAFSHN